MITHNRAVVDVAKHISGLGLSHPTRVAVDGRTASGKTTFADALAAKMEQHGHHVIRASVDGFRFQQEL